MDNNSSLRRLTSRESEIAGLIAGGYTNAEIAEILGISFWTAKWHVSEIITKLGVESREDVTAAWKREHSLRGRLRRAQAGILGGFSLKPTFAVIAGTGLTFAGLAVAVAYTSGAGERRIFVEADPSSPVFVHVPATSTPTAVPVRAPSPREYVVQEGDTCESIAAGFGMPPIALFSRNRELLDACPDIEPGQVLDLTVHGPSSLDSSSFIRLADLDGDPSSGYISGVIDPVEGLAIRQFGGVGTAVGDHGSSSFRGWELFIAGGSSSNGVGGQMAVAGSERIARIDLVVDGGPPTTFTPQTAPAALGYPLRVLYVTLPPGHVWEFWAYDDAGNYLGTVAHGSSVGAGEAYVDKVAPGGPTATPSGPRPDPLEAMSNGHVLRISPGDGTQVTRAETASSIDPLSRNGICADVTEAGHGPPVNLEDFEILVDDEDVTSQLTRHFDGDPLTATSATLCYAPDGGLAEGLHLAEIRILLRGIRQNGYESVVRWQFEVMAEVGAGE